MATTAQQHSTHSTDNDATGPAADENQEPATTTPPALREARRLAWRWRWQAMPLAGIAATHGVGAATAALDWPAALAPAAVGLTGSTAAYAYAHRHTGRWNRVYAGIAAAGSALFQMGLGFAGGNGVLGALLWGCGSALTIPWWIQHCEPDPDVTAEHAASTAPTPVTPKPLPVVKLETSPEEIDRRTQLWNKHMAANGKSLPHSTLDEFSEFECGWKATINLPVEGHWEEAFSQRKKILSVYDLPDNRAFVESIPGVTVRKCRLTVLTSDPLQQKMLWTGPGLDPATGNFKLMTTADAESLYYRLWEPGAGAKHGLISGITRSGKTKVVELILTECGMSDRIEPLVIDGGGGASLPQWVDRVKLFAKTPDDARKVLRYALARMDQRRSVLERQGGGSLDPAPDMPLIPVVIDEAHKLLMSDDEVDNRDIVRMCERITQEGAKFGVGLILSTQAPTAKQLGNSTVLRDQVKSGTIVGLRTMEKGNEGMISTGDPMPENLRDLPAEFPNGASTHGLGYMMTSRKIRARALLLERSKDWPVTVVESEPEAANVLLPRMSWTTVPATQADTAADQSSGDRVSQDDTAADDDAVLHALVDGCGRDAVSVMQATGLSMGRARAALKRIKENS